MIEMERKGIERSDDEGIEGIDKYDRRNLEYPERNWNDSGLIWNLEGGMCSSVSATKE